MKKIRIGNDFTITRTIVRGDIPEDLVNVFNPKLELISYFAVPTVNPPYTISDVNKIDVNIETQYVPKVGKYKLVFSYDVPEVGFVDDFRKVTIDIANFEIVSESSKADSCNDVAAAGQIEIGIKGDSAFRVWLGEAGNAGKTKEDYFNWLQEPATEAADLANLATQAANTATGLTIAAKDDYYNVVKPEIIAQGNYVTAQGDYAKAQGEAVEGAITDLQTDLGLKLDKTSVKQTTGTSETDVMSQKAVTDEIAQLAGEVSLLDAVQGAKIKDIENVLSTANLNQSAQLSVSGVPPLSLPKNAANGGMSVKLEGLTAENIIPNGDFRNGLTNWGNSNLVMDGEFAKSTGSGYQNIPILANVKYYISVKYKSDGIGTRQLALRNWGSNVATPALAPTKTNTTISVDSYVCQTTSAGERLSVIVATAGTVWFSYIILINLTSTFGAGNEPTKEQCDLMFSDYFEGLKSFEPTGRVRSVGKNLFDFGYWKNISNYPTSAIGGYRSGSWQLKPNTTYTFRVTLKGDEKPTSYFQVSGGDESRRAITSPTRGYPSVWSFTTGSDGILMLYVSGAQVGLTSQFETTNFMVVEGDIASPYEPYKETNLYLTAPELRSNGTVKDEIRKGANGYELVKRINSTNGTVLATPEITSISYGGILNSAENGTVYHEPIIADAGVYETKMDILLTDYPIATIEEIIKHENGIDTYLDVVSAVIAGDGLSFTHPDLTSGDLVLFTYAFDKESTNGNITASFYDSNVVKIDTVTGKAYKINEVITNGVLTRTLTEV